MAIKGFPETPYDSNAENIYGGRVYPRLVFTNSNASARQTVIGERFRLISGNPDTFGGKLDIYDEKTGSTYDVFIEVQSNLIPGTPVQNTLNLSGTSVNIDAADTSNGSMSLGFGSAGNPLLISYSPADGGHSNGTEIVTKHVVPATTNTYDCGTASLKWSLVRGTTITSGDLAWEETECHYCGKRFKNGEKLAITVKEMREKDGELLTYTVPVHFTCPKDIGWLLRTIKHCVSFLTRSRI